MRMHVSWEYINIPLVIQTYSLWQNALLDCLFCNFLIFPTVIHIMNIKIENHYVSVETVKPK